MRPLPKGIYTPLPCFFKENEDLDLDDFVNHLKFVALAGTIPVISGSAGEAVHLDREERILLIKTARATLDGIGLTQLPIIAGVGAASTRESIKLAQDASEAGADYGMVIPPGYYAGVLIASRDSLKSFFVDIATASPLPIIIYNFPGVSAGINLDSDLVIDIVKAAPSVCGIKLTCADVGKLTRIMAVASDPDFRSTYPRSHPELSFVAIDGFIDFLLPSVAVGSAGAISGLPNVAPKACVKLWKLCQSPKDASEALALQNLISLADRVQLKIGIHGMKKLLHRTFGYSPVCRRPLPAMTDEAADIMFADNYLQELMQMEATL